MGKMDRIFARRLKEIRDERGMTLDDLSSATGISKSLLSMYENGQRKIPGSDKLFSLGKELNVNPGWLLGDTDERSTVL